MLSDERFIMKTRRKIFTKEEKRSNNIISVETPDTKISHLPRYCQIAILLFKDLTAYVMTRYTKSYFYTLLKQIFS